MAREIQKIRDQSAAEIETELNALREQLFKLRWQAANGQVENNNKIRAVRRQIARHLGVLRERELARSGEAEA